MIFGKQREFESFVTVRVLHLRPIVVIPVNPVLFENIYYFAAYVRGDRTT